MNLDKKNIIKITGILSFCILLYCALQNLSAVLNGISVAFSYISPFILGAAIAFVINVPMSFFERNLFPKAKKLNKIRRPLAFIITLLLVILAIAALLVTVIPELVSTFIALGEKLPSFTDTMLDKLEVLFKNFPVLQEWIANIETLDWSSILKSVSSWLSTGVSSTLTIAGNALNGLVSFLIGFVFAIYVLMQKEKLGRQLKLVMYTIFPEKAVDKIIDITNISAKTFSNFLSGQCLEACILGLMFALVMTICRMPYVALISILIAFTALIPLVGAFIGCFVGAFLILMQNPIQAVWFIIIFLILQQIEGNLIYPKVVGNSVGLPAIWVLVVITIGGKFMGIMGMIIMIPISSVLYTLFRTYIYKKLNTRSTRVKRLFGVIKK